MIYDARSFKKAFDLIESVVSQGVLPSGILGIAQKDGIVDIKAFGHWKDSKKVREDDIYLLFSSTKPFIGLAVMQLWERGKLHPNQRVRDIIPEFSGDGKEKITIWHLLTHTSGLDQSILDHCLEGNAPESIMQHEWLVQYAARKPLRSEPGKFREYNNIAFSVMAEIISRVGQKPYDAYIEENILAPLKMNDSAFDMLHKKPERVIPIMGSEGFSRIEKSFSSAKFPAGGLYSTAEDMLRFGRMLLHNGTLEGRKIINSLTLEAMITPQTVSVPRNTDLPASGETFDEEFGLVWNLPINKRSIIYRDIYGHNGMGGCMFWVYPKKELTFTFLTNRIGMPFDLDHLHNVLSSCL